MRSLAEIVPPGELTRTMMPLMDRVLPGGLELAIDLVGLRLVDNALDVDHRDAAGSRAFPQDGRAVSAAARAGKDDDRAEQQEKQPDVRQNGQAEQDAPEDPPAADLAGDGSG